MRSLFTADLRVSTRWRNGRAIRGGHVLVIDGTGDVLIPRDSLRVVGEYLVAANARRAARRRG